VQAGVGVCDVLGSSIVSVPWWDRLHHGIQGIPGTLYTRCCWCLLRLYLGHNDAWISHKYPLCGILPLVLYLLFSECQKHRLKLFNVHFWLY